MKRITFALVAATLFAAPLAAQQRNDGPWWDPANTGSRSGSTERVDTRDGRIYDRDGRIYDDRRVYDSRRVDGQWRRVGRDRSGRTVYARTVRDRNHNVVREIAVRDRNGRYRVVDRDIVQRASRRNDGDWDRRANGRDRNDRWDQNNGHDNGKHSGWYKDKNKNKNKNKGRGNR
jgi:hypothetical protein